MYCNLSLETKRGIVVVTEVDFTPEKTVPIVIRAGYALDKRGKSLPFWSFVNEQFVNRLVQKHEL